jgi:hypothetical protein
MRTGPLDGFAITESGFRGLDMLRIILGLPLC